jgi:hypothetical protein
MIRMEHIRVNSTAVVSGEESEDSFLEEDTDSSSEDEDDIDLQMDHTAINDDEQGVESQSSGANIEGNVDDLYDENLDAEDEAYVYKNMRGGVREMVTIVQQQQQQPYDMERQQNSTEESLQEVNSKNSNQNLPRKQRQRLLLYKPRNSDAVLSCPCCFNIVCMDCQRHTRYPNQFRAIFVMGITVDWHKVLVYDAVHQALVSKSDFSPEHHAHHDGPTRRAVEQENEQIDDPQSLSWLEQPVVSTAWRPPTTKEGEYFAVECASCGTQVAALDMGKEVYHFHGCLVSSAPTC